MGDEKFSEFLYEYADQFSNKISTGEDFISLLNSYHALDSVLWLSDYLK
jgi:hypothetical protein